MPKLARYVNDGRFRPDNNDIEEVIRPLKVGLNNYGYCHNHDAAYRAAMIYSFIATCNKADVNPREWMEDVMPQMKGIARTTSHLWRSCFPVNGRRLIRNPTRWSTTRPRRNTWPPS